MHLCTDVAGGVFLLEAFHVFRQGAIPLKSAFVDVTGELLFIAEWSESVEQ